MEGERKRSKGSFFHLFDWNGKSRKKLFPKDPEFPEGTEQGKENVESLAELESHKIEVDERRENSSNRGSSDLSCSASVTSDDGFGSGAKPPGVVARLMGLDSLPEPLSAPFLGSSESRYDRSTPNLWSEYNPMGYIGVSSNRGGVCSNSLESRRQKVQNRPIERFQTETLPPKSAKSIPITHHKLLSPIKSPGFIPTKNTAYIMKAAAKIIEASPKATINGRVLSISSSSVPLRIRDLKQKMEAANKASKPRRPDERIAAKNRKGQVSDKGKSFSLTSRNITTTTKQAIRSDQSLKGKPGKRTSENRTSNMLRQNNQKQNCQTGGEESSTLKNSVPNQPRRKARSMGGSVGQSKNVNKSLKSETMSKKIRSVPMDSGKDKSNGITLKKQPVNGDPGMSRTVSIKCNVEVEGRINTDIYDRKDGMDVVSFTFTSPVKRAAPKPLPSTMEKSNNSANDSLGSSNKSCSFHGLNIIGADALGALLEEKLRELTYKVESSQCSMIRDDISNFVSTFDALNNTIPAAEISRFSLSTKDSSFIENQEWQDSADMEECSSFSVAEKDNYGHPSPVSILEPSFESGSCSITNADEVLSGFSANEYLEGDGGGDIELSDSATSIISTIDTRSKHFTGTFKTDWELDYVRVILDSAETMLKDFGLGKTSEFVTLQLFHHLENQDHGMKQNDEDYSKLERKVLFDCVSECLDLISRHTFVGSCTSWDKLREVFERKDWMAGKFWKEISGWKNMGDLMVDELVDRDMSTLHGNWLEFNVELLEEGVDIEKEVLSCLIDELVSDIFVL